MTLIELAYRIQVHLRHMAADPRINSVNSDGLRPFYFPYASRCGSRVEIRYVTYQVSSKLTRENAEAYLAWLDAGNRGCHYDMEKKK